ncbi:hypothetical protein BFL36_12815 [Clavibacter michiganensis]|uniref:Uncharacterized protein n=1 Tax=Clavibacter michiganensis TaxID=28447 RepID=A0A251Y3S2_9MICO|nr:hypothetical protein [Clavibacter michiganensis]OUE18917.1 hypothetical protein BFL36_12815 [Clavibacter michiganensis]
MNISASRLAYLVTFNASLITALLVALLAPERGSGLLALGLCVGLLVWNVDLLERRTALAAEEGDGAHAATRSRSRSSKAVDAAQPTVFALSAVLAMVVRQSPALVIGVAAMAMVVGVVAERATRGDRSRTSSAAAIETWRARGPSRWSDLGYVLFLLAMAALSLGLPDDLAVVVPVALAAVVVLLVIACGQRRIGRRGAPVSSTADPGTR